MEMREKKKCTDKGNEEKEKRRRRRERGKEKENWR